MFLHNQINSSDIPDPNIQNFSFDMINCSANELSQLESQVLEGIEYPEVECVALGKGLAFSTHVYLSNRERIYISKKKPPSERFFFGYTFLCCALFPHFS